MGLFKKKQDDSRAPAPAWEPTVDLATARAAVFALANAPVSNDAQVRDAIFQFVRLSERPPLERALDLMRSDPDWLHRPWIWLAAVMHAAAANEDHHLASAGLYWACYWTSDLVPRNDLGAFMELELDPIPDRFKAEIHRLGVTSAQQLPQDLLVVGDSTGSIHAGPLAEMAAGQLGL